MKDFYTITCHPDGTCDVFREFDHYDDGNNPEKEPFGLGKSTFTGTYNILENNSEILRVNIVLTKETTKSSLYGKILRNDVNIELQYSFDFIENRLRNRKGLSKNTIFFKNMNYKDDSTVFEREIDKLKILGLSNEEIIEGMYKFDKNIIQFLFDKFTEYNLKENIAW